MSFNSKCQKVCQEFFTGVDRKEFKKELLNDISGSVKEQWDNMFESKSWQKKIDDMEEQMFSKLRLRVENILPDLIQKEIKKQFKELLEAKNEPNKKDIFKH